MSEALERVPYDACPLCGGEALLDGPSYDCTVHPLYQPPLPPVMNWCECYRCGHMFTDGYFGPEALTVLFSRTGENQEPGERPDKARLAWARVLERVAERVRSPFGRWLDVGFGDGGLLCNAAEWGFDPLGIDLRMGSVEKLAALGIPARRAELEAIDEEGAFGVISMADVLEHMPFPPRALRHVHRLLRKDGLLFLSMPNRDTVLWRMLEARTANSYLVEIEHYHNFTRARLYALLAEVGFAPEWYGVSERYVCGMEIIARRVG